MSTITCDYCKKDVNEIINPFDNVCACEACHDKKTMRWLKHNERKQGLTISDFRQIYSTKPIQTRLL